MYCLYQPITARSVIHANEGPHLHQSQQPPPPCMCERVYLHHPWPSAEPGVEGIASALKGQEWPQGHRTVGNCGDKLCLHYGWDRAFTSKWLWEQVLPNYLGDPGTRKGSASYQLESQLSWPPTSSLIERNNKHDKRRFC